MAQKRGAEMRDQAQQLIAQGKEVATEYYEESRNQVLAWQQQLENQVREKPLQSLLVAAELVSCLACSGDDSVGQGRGIMQVQGERPPWTGERALWTQTEHGHIRSPASRSHPQPKRSATYSSKWGNCRRM